MSDGTCALWYIRYGTTDYELCDDEGEAARYAVHMIEAETGAPLGVQFPDGRTLRVEDWPAYATEEQRESERPTLRPVVRPTRLRRDPFTGDPVKVDVEDPGWVGSG